MSAHAKLSPSAAYRWFACPGSVRATAGLPDDSNEYAREGTAAHTLGERCLKTGTDASKWVGTHEGRIAVDYVDTAGKPQRQFFIVDQEMAEAVQVYLDAVRGIASAQGARLMVEERVRLASIDPELEPVWGTSDAIVYVPEGRILYPIDYKHGRGKVVSVDDNLQLKIYALAAWAEHHSKYPVDKVVPIIVQPRAGGEPVRSTEYTAAELLDFAQDVLDAVERTKAPDAPLVPGSHCDFCKIRATCPARAKQAMAVAQEEFSAPVTPQQLSMERCVEVLDKLEPLEELAKHIRQYLHESAQNGIAVPGYKLVPKRGTRQWAKPEQEILRRLQPLVAMTDDLYKKELLSPAQVEKVVGKKAFPADLVATVSSGYNLVRDTDSRPAITLHPGDDFVALEN